MVGSAWVVTMTEAQQLVSDLEYRRHRLLLRLQDYQQSYEDAALVVVLHPGVATRQHAHGAKANYIRLLEQIELYDAAISGGPPKRPSLRDARKRPADATSKEATGDISRIQSGGNFFEISARRRVFDRGHYGCLAILTPPLPTLSMSLKDARDIGQAVTLMYVLFFAFLPYVHCGKYEQAKPLIDELMALADEKGALQWKAFGMMSQGYALAMNGRAADERYFERPTSQQPPRGRRMPTRPRRESWHCWHCSFSDRVPRNEKILLCQSFNTLS
jgi:hypothetical protein